MSFINYSTKEVNCKIVYLGRAWAGKRRTFSTSTSTRRPTAAASSSRSEHRQRADFVF